MRKIYCGVITLLLSTIVAKAQWQPLTSPLQEGPRDESLVSDLNADGTVMVVGTGGFRVRRDRVSVYNLANGNLTQKGNTINSPIPTEADFGFTVSIDDSGNRIAVGAPFDRINGIRRDRVFIYEFDGSRWQLLDTFFGTTSGSAPAYDVSMSGDGKSVAIGSTGRAGTGTVTVYKERSNGDWRRIGQEVPSGFALDNFGYSVDLNFDGTRFIGGGDANNADFDPNLPPNVGSVYVYELLPTGWAQISPRINGDFKEDRFGHSVAINDAGDRIVVGANENDDGGNLSGHTKVFEQRNGEWVQLGQTIVGEAGDFSGGSVDMNPTGNIIVVGAYAGGSGDQGRIRVYELVGNQWRQIDQTIVGSRREEFLGWNVSISDDGSRVVASSFGQVVRTFVNPRLASRSGAKAAVSNNVAAKAEVESISVYPNPGSGFFQIDMPNASGAVSVTIADVSGKLVYEASFEENENIQISHDLSTGLYILNVASENAETYSQKLSIE